MRIVVGKHQACVFPSSKPSSEKLALGLVRSLELHEFSYMLSEKPDVTMLAGGFRLRVSTIPRCSAFFSLIADNSRKRTPFRGVKV